jgi:hypothetical protein
MDYFQQAEKQLRIKSGFNMQVVRWWRLTAQVILINEKISKETSTIPDLYQNILWRCMRAGQVYRPGAAMP